MQSIANFALTALFMSFATHAATVFSFDNDTVGTSTQFTDTADGLSATFSSPGDPGGFSVQPSIFETLTGNALGDPGPSGLMNLSLAINFSSNLSAIDLVFATGDFGPPSPLTLNAYEGSTLVGSASATGMVLEVFPEGELAFDGANFNNIVLSSPAPVFAIDNVEVATATTPEPGPATMLALGLAFVAVSAIRRRTKAAVVCSIVATGSVFAQTKAILPLAPSTVSTIPANGDVNPYGVAFVPRGIPAGVLQGGDILVSNFNNNQNLQGTGTTIVRVNSSGQPSLFFSASVTGLTAAIGVLANGTVIIGNLPTADGTSATAQSGSLAFIDRNGHSLGSVFTPTLVNGPWGLALHDLNNGQAQVFVSNVLTGTITRFDVTYSFTNTAVSITKAVTVGSGFTHRLDPAALVLGPSGMAYDAVHNLLYVASSSDNAIYALANVATATASVGAGTLIYQDFTHLHGPLQMVLAPNGDLLVANSDGSNANPSQPSELVEFTTGGQFIGESPVDPNNGGAFGLALFNIGWGTVRLAYVDDNANSLTTVTTVIQ